MPRDSGPFRVGERVLVPHTDKYYEAKVSVCVTLSMSGACAVLVMVVTEEVELQSRECMLPEGNDPEERGASELCLSGTMGVRVSEREAFDPVCCECDMCRGRGRGRIGPCPQGRGWQGEWVALQGVLLLSRNKSCFPRLLSVQERDF
jgi:hypothetical protein